MARADRQGVIMSQTHGAMHTTWRSMSMLVSKRPRVTLCGTPGRDVLLEPVVDGLGSATPSRNGHLDQASERTVPTIPEETAPRTSTEEGNCRGTVTSENYIK